MSRRNYRQHCGVAVALDALGDRWTLLIVRDLSLGPQRYTDLLKSLDGIGTDVLAERLRRLQTLGAVQKDTHDPPFVSTTYRLTERGDLLAPALSALSAFGMSMLDDPLETESRHDLGWALLSVAGQYSGDADDTSYEFRTPQGTFHIEIAEGSAIARRGPTLQPPSVVLTADDAMLIAGVVTGYIDLDQLVERDAIRLGGTADAIAEIKRLFLSHAS